MSDASWVDGFNTAVGNYLVSNDGNWSWAPDVFNRSAVGEHIVNECSLASVDDVDQSIETVSVVDSFDADASRATAYVSARVTCACGKYERFYIAREADFTDIVRGVATA